MKYLDVLAALERMQGLADGIARGTITGPEGLPLYSTQVDNYVGRAARNIERDSLAVKAWLREQTITEIHTTNPTGAAGFIVSVLPRPTVTP